MSDWTNKLRGMATVAADGGELQKEAIDICTKIENGEKKLAQVEEDIFKEQIKDEPSEKTVAKLHSELNQWQIQIAKWKIRGKQLYQDICGYPMRDGVSQL